VSEQTGQEAGQEQEQQVEEGNRAGKGRDKSQSDLPGNRARGQGMGKAGRRGTDRTPPGPGKKTNPALHGIPEKA
jgi:hypothetical protein